jgi:hypothetical protein
MKKVLAVAGIAAFFGLNACTALTSSKDASSTAQLHDARMRMRHGQLVNVQGNNYGTSAVMSEEHSTTSMPSNANTTVRNQRVANPTAGNATPPETMIDANTRPDPAPTSGN